MMTMTPSISATMSKWPPQIFVIFSSVILVYFILKSGHYFDILSSNTLYAGTFLRFSEPPMDAAMRRCGDAMFDCVK